MELKGIGETHISSRVTLPRLSTNPGVDSLRGKAAVKQWELKLDEMGI